MFDRTGNFFVTDFDSQAITKFDPNGTLIGNFGSGYNLDPESILRNASGNIFVGQADGTHQVLEFKATGTLIRSFAPATENRGTDWITLASDECTMFYTSEGPHVKRFNICTNTQLPDFNTTPLPGSAFALRIRPTADVLVADYGLVVRLDASGNQIQTYTLTGPSGAESCLFALSLDPDDTSFWTADLCTADVLRVDITSGSVLESFNAGSGLTVAGLSVKNEICAACAKNIAKGTDYFSTQFGTKFDFGPPIGTVEFEGGAPCAGTADTMVQRQADAIITGAPGTAAPIPIQLVCLSLKSIAPVKLKGTFFDVFVTLDPTHLAQDTGTMTISENAAGTGGTFTSSLTVFFEADFVAVSGGAGFKVFAQKSITNTGSTWSSTPPNGTFLVTGPDDNSSADQLANKHTGLASNEEDFYVVKILSECTADLVDCHIVGPGKVESTGPGPDVAMGTDYFTTQGGTHFNFGDGIGDVQFEGVSIVGTADTIVERQLDAAVGPGGTSKPIPIQIVGFSLKSISPVNVGGTMFDVFVKLDPANLANDTGTMTISENSAGTGGTFISHLTVFFEADFVPVNGGQGFSILTSIKLKNPGATWSSTPPAGIMIITGPDDGSSADQLANMHTGLVNEIDFFVPQVFDECSQSRAGCTNEDHRVGPAPTPE
jgi:hypothetical protein